MVGYTSPDRQSTGPPRALTVAGSDSGGGAGIQADLKTFAALGVYGVSAITALTAQNTLGVRAVQEVSPEMVAAQMDAVLEDIGAGAAKTGMLASTPIIMTVVERLRHYGLSRLVVDPVMVAKSGDRLLREDAIRALLAHLLPLALVVTPNIPEAEVLSGMLLVPSLGKHAEADASVLAEAARRIAANGPRYVLIKGGHLPGAPVDWLWDGMAFTCFPGERIATTSTHGTGCTLSAAITAYLACSMDVPEAVAQAKVYLTQAMRHAQPIGQGHGPLHHLWVLDRTS